MSAIYARFMCNSELYFLLSKRERLRENFRINRIAIKNPFFDIFEDPKSVKHFNNAKMM